MITSLQIRNFKSLRDVTLKLGQLNFFIGTNAAGKSNVFDALRVLQGIGNGFTLAEILDGKPRSATSEQWEPIRGGSQAAAFSREDDKVVRFHLHTKRMIPGATRKLQRVETYSIGFHTIRQRLVHEDFKAGNAEIYNSAEVSNPPKDPVFKVLYRSGKQGKQPHVPCEPGRPVLTQLSKGEGKWSKSHAERAAQFSRFLANMQRLDPSPAVLREYSTAHHADRIGERGENFAGLIETIRADDQRKDAYLTWLKQLRPAEVDDIGILKGALGESMFSITEGGRVFPAPVLSDGTLRFAAITAAFFQPDMPAILTLEEIENGVHASRLRLLLELLRSHAREGGPQVICTTHSPTLLNWLDPEEYQHTFFCKRDEETGESRILPLTEIPHFNDVVKKQSVGELFTEGWMEAML